jgi:two-component system phosphate regulon sensor histidine kinase PhoR
MNPYVLLTISVALAIALTLCILKGRRLLAELQKCRDKQRALQETHDEEKITTARQLLDAVQVGLLIISSDGRILWSNQEAQNLFGSRTVDDKLVEEAFMDSDLVDFIREGLATEESLTRKISLPVGALSGDFHDDAGETHWIVEIKPVASHVPPTEFIIGLRDITKSVRSDQIRTDFVANASHELRTPLTIIGGYVENLLEDDLLEEPEASRHALGIMHKHVERISRIVEDMLAISRLESGEISTLNITAFSIEDCINDVLKRLEALIQKQKATVTVRIPDPDLSPEADRFYMTQILFNLVENALKQNSTMPVEITITAREIGDAELFLEVCDNGRGIPSSDLPFIFKRFFRVEKHHSQGEVKGTGLGLSIVKRAVEAHGGTITASSTPGVQTCFTLQVPMTHGTDQE